MVSFSVSDLLALVAEPWRGVGMGKVLTQQLISPGVDPPSQELGERVPWGPSILSVPCFYKRGLGRREPTAFKVLAWDLASARGDWGQKEKPEFLLYPGRKPLD